MYRCAAYLRLANVISRLKKCTRSAAVSPVRWLNLHEYQSKQLMEEYGVAVQKFEVCETVRDAEGAAQRLAPGADELVVKAQILAGGRGKGVFDTGYKGGVKVTTDPSDVGMFAGAMLGNRLVTKQTKKGGEQVTKVIVTQGFGPPRETYFAILMDREYSGPTVVASAAGGMDIEQVAASTPEKIVTVPIDIKVGLTRDCARDLALKLEFKQPDEAAEQMQKLYEMFIDVDAVQVEINPLGETKDGRVLCYDAKVNFDDNAKFRQQKIFEMEDESELDPREVIAAQHHLNYIGMDGNIGCLVNGAGLAMATMDIIQANGGMPANFLDVGGGVNERQVIEAFGILTSDEQVKSIFVNIFGGIVNCVTIAQGVTKACQEVEVKVPLVVRLQGNNVDAAKEVMRNSGLNIMSEDDMDEAAKKAVQSARL